MDYSSRGGKEWDTTEGLSLPLPSPHCLHRMPQSTYFRSQGVPPETGIPAEGVTSGAQAPASALAAASCILHSALAAAFCISAV